MNLNIYKQVFLMEIRKIITYRLDFWGNFIGQTFFKLMLSYFLWKNIFEYQKVNIINGFSFEKIVLYYIVVSVIFKTQNAGLIGIISTEIYTGALNKFILYPINFFTYKLATYLANASIYLFQLFLILLIYHYIIMPIPLQESYFLIFLFLISILLSSICYFFLSSICELVAFWADNIWSLGVMLRFAVSFFGGVLIPLSFFPQWSLEVLKYTPFPYLVSFSMDLFWGDINPTDIIKGFGIQIFWIICFYSISNFFWRKGRLKYTGVGI